MPKGLILRCTFQQFLQWRLLGVMSVDSPPLSVPSTAESYFDQGHCHSGVAYIQWLFQPNSRQLWGIGPGITAWLFPLLTPLFLKPRDCLCVAAPQAAMSFTHIVTELNSFMSFWSLFKTQYLNEPCLTTLLNPVDYLPHQQSWSASSCSTFSFFSIPTTLYYAVSLTYLLCFYFFSFSPNRT